MSYTHILGVDPSGNKSEGSGCSGLALLNLTTEDFDLSEISADEFETQYQYWKAHVLFLKQAIEKHGKSHIFIVIEDYRLDPNRAAAQSHSAMETPKLIGVLQFMLSSWGVSFMMQPASAVKNRWCDEILLRKGILSTGAGERRRWYYKGAVTNDHKRDALRHAWHVHVFKKWEDRK